MLCGTIRGRQSTFSRTSVDHLDDILSPPSPRNAYEIWKAGLSTHRFLGPPLHPSSAPYQVALRVDDIPHGESVVVTAGRVQRIRLPARVPTGDGAPESLPSMRANLPPEFALAAEEIEEATAFLATAVAASSFERFRAAWKHFLLSLGRTHAKTIRLAKHGAGKEWARSEQQLHLTDPLLYYLREARNEAEHGVAEVVLRGTDSISLGPAPGTGGLLPDVLFGDGALTVRGRPGTCPLLITRTAWRPLLCAVTNKKGANVPLPAAHLGNQIRGEDPISVGRFGLTYHRRALAAAARQGNT
jgi:hypothetical protein